MKKSMTICAGIAMMLTALWIGAYVLGQLPSNHWARFPTIATTVICVFGGYGTAMYGFIYMKGKP